MMDLGLKDLMFRGVQLVMVTSIIASNRADINYLKWKDTGREKQYDELKDWLNALQERVDNIRVKVGI